MTLSHGPERPAMPGKYPSPAYLLGALLDDAVPTDLALKIAGVYATAWDELSDDQTRQWLALMHAGLIDAGHGGISTTFAVMAIPSDHDQRHYEALARTADPREA